MTWCASEVGRRAGPRLPGGRSPPTGVPGAGLRLADRGGAAQPAERGDRAAAARHAGLRLPDPARRWPSTCATELLGAEAEAPAPVLGAVADRRRPDRDRGDGCRFPGGVGSPEDLWELRGRRRRRDLRLPDGPGLGPGRAVRPGPGPAGQVVRREGGFLHDAGEFDAGFFGISPREALAMDPQQRLLLETSWEALERAGIDPASLRGSRTGVFAGRHRTTTTATVPAASPRAGGLPAHRQRGAACCPAGCRTRLGLEGPAVTVDTACSSSLVALHLAVPGAAVGRVLDWRWPAG